MSLQRQVSTGVIPQGINPIIFTEHSVTCKMCGKESKQRKIKSHLLVEQDLDIDLRPRKYVWSIKNSKTPHPPHYYMCRCPHCNFTAASASFQEPLRTVRMSVTRFKSKIDEKLKNQSGLMKVVSELAKSIEGESRNHSQAIKMHLLAIFHLQIVDEIAKMDSIDLGRYCLRLGWLFREIEEQPELKAEHGASVTKLVSAIKAQWPEVPDSEQKALQFALQYYSTALEKSTTIGTVKEEVELLLLISRISMRLQDVPTARKYVEVAKERVRKLEEKQKVSNDPALLADIRRVKASTDIVQNVLQDVRDTLDEEFERQARELIQKHPGKTPDQLKVVLTEARFAERIITAVLPKPPPKKGFFGF